MVMPFRPPTAPPMVSNTSVRAVSRKVVRKTFICISPVDSKETLPPQDSNGLDSGCCRRLLFRLGGGARKFHGVLVAVAVHPEVISRQHLAFENLQSERILNQALNRAS